MARENEFGSGERLKSKWSQIKEATKLALEHRERVKEGDLSVFLMPLAFAIAKDCIFDIIPVVGTIFGVFITVYLFIFMWGRGRLKLRIIFFIVGILDLIPGINLIPFNTVSVIYAYHLARKDAEKSREELGKLDKSLAGLTRQEQILEQRARLEAQRAQEAALVEEVQGSKNTTAETAKIASRMDGAHGRKASETQVVPSPGGRGVPSSTPYQSRKVA